MEDVMEFIVLTGLILLILFAKGGLLNPVDKG